MNNWAKVGGVAAGLSLAIWALRNHLKLDEEELEEQATPSHEGQDGEDTFLPASKAARKGQKVRRLRRKQKRKRKQAFNLNRGKAQVAVTNNSSTTRTIHLWGNGNQQLASTNGLSVDDHAVVQVIGENAAVFNHPQGVAARSDGSLLVVNQLGDSVTRVAEDGTVISQIELGATAPGTISPVAVAVDPVTDYAYVAGSVANTISVIDDTDQLIETIPVGSRPIAVGLHPVSGKVYVINHRDQQISVIDPNSNQVEATLPTGAAPTSIAFDPQTENAFVVNSGDNSITVFDRLHQPQNTFTGIGRNPQHVVFHPEQNKLFVTLSDDHQVAEMDPATGQVDHQYAVGGNPGKLDYHPLNGMLYVANQRDQSFSVLDLDTQLTTTVPATGLDVGWAIHPRSGQVFISATHKNTLAVLGFDALQNSIQVSENYHRLSEDFRYNPARLTHTKWVHHGKPVRTVMIQGQHATGTTETFPHSLTNYDSPQQGVPVSEISGSKDWIIDGRHSWEFELCPGSSAIIIIYYQQWTRKKLLRKNKKQR